MLSSRWKYNTDDLLVKVLKAIKNGMTESWEYRERFGSRTTISVLLGRKYVNYRKNTGYVVTPEGEAWLLEKLNENFKSKSDM